MVFLDGIVDNPEPGPFGGLAQRLPERPHEASPTQRRHVVEHAHGDQHRAAVRDGLPGAVRHAEPAGPPPAGAGACAAAAGRTNSKVVCLGSWRRFLFTAGVTGGVPLNVDSLRLDTVSRVFDEIYCTGRALRKAKDRANR